MASLLSLNNALPTHRWHKMLSVAGLVIFIISVTFPATWLPSHLLGTLGLGLMFIGLGDWKGIRTRLKGETSIDWLGMTMTGVGYLLLLWSLVTVVVMLVRSILPA